MTEGTFDNFEMELTRLGATLRDSHSLELPGIADSPEEIKPGQIWRARWDEVVALVFIDALVGGIGNQVRVAPVTFGDDEADDSAAIMPATSNTLNTAFTLWPELVAEIAEVVLEQWVATSDDVLSSLADIESAVASGALRRGYATVNPNGRRAKARRLLNLSIDVLANAAYLPEGTAKLSELLRGKAPTAIAAILTVDNSTALKIVRGTHLITREQAILIAPIVGRSPDDVYAAGPALPDNLRSTLTRLSRGAPVREIATRRNQSDSETLTALAQSSLALAARGDTGPAPDWDGRVDRSIQMWLAES